MIERPILFSAQMVCAILDDRKTKTRRPIKRQPPNNWLGYTIIRPGVALMNGPDYPDAESDEICCPYGNPGDRLWVRETFCMVEGDKFAEGGIPMPIIYRADETRHGGKWMNHHNIRWTSSIYMPRKVSRITLEIVGVRVERVQEITTTECFNEGICIDVAQPTWAFEELWNVINDKRGFGWCRNPWVWVIKFKRIKEGAPT